MKSIRRRLTVWLLSGLAFLWVAAGAGIYYAAREGLLKSIDAELAVDARIVRFAARGEESDGDEEMGSRQRGGRLQDRMPAYDQPESGAFFQMWNAEGAVLERSASLGGGNLAFPETAGTDPAFETARLDDGRKIRTMSFRVASFGGGRGPGKSKAKGGSERHGSGATVTVLAKDLSGVEQTLSSLLGGIALVGLLVGGGAILLVGAALHHGLKPLRELGKQTASIDAGSLDARFDATGAPVELRPIYAHLNELIHRLETSFERERRFSSDLAHEMRTPVAELKMLSEVALKWPDQGGPEAHAEGLEIARRLESMIENLLALARWESGELSLKREPANLGELLRKGWEPFAASAAEKGIEVSFEFGVGTPVLETDPDMLRHIIGNLLSNAAEYTPEGGRIQISAFPGGLAVANAASDLKESQVDRLFDRHWRADASRSDSRHAGLGLSLARTCAEALGFSLSARLTDGILHLTLKESDA